MKILIIDDHPLFVDGLANMLTSKLSGSSVEKANNAVQALAIIESKLFDLIMIDLTLPEVSGVDLLRALSARGIWTTSILISASDDISIINKALEEGANGYIPKFYCPDKIIDAIHTVMNDGEFIPDEIKNKLGQYRRLSNPKQHKLNIKKTGLTKRQNEVLVHLTEGHSNRTISELLNLSIDTVKTHVRKIYLILDVDSRASCIVKARNLKLT